MSVSVLLSDTFALERKLHADQTRKGSGIPYITHLMSVAALVGEYGGKEDQMIAALLHDAVEDQGGPPTLRRTRTAFGETVADLLNGCSDADTLPKPPWQERKQAFVDRTRSAPPSIKLVVAADKLHNMQSIARDVEGGGAGVWDRFKGKRDDTLWYHQEMLRALATNWEHPIRASLEMALKRLQESDSG